MSEIETFGASIKIAEPLFKTGALLKFNSRLFKVIPSASKTKAIFFKLASEPSIDNV